MKADAFFAKGWCRFSGDPQISGWLEHALPAARRTVADARNSNWLRCGGTWFAGVNVLPNNASGAIGDGPPLAGHAIDFIANVLGLRDFPWDRGQVSVCYPGYPKPMDSEPETAFRYRLKRDAAHVDGLRRVGPDRRRHVHERHGFLLGIPLVSPPPDASPFVVWERSHEKVRSALSSCLGDMPHHDWESVDVTDAYHAVRRDVFETCRRVEVHCRPGEAFLVHRLALHGTAPWTSEADAGPDGRMIAFFRPELSRPEDWLSAH